MLYQGFVFIFSLFFCFSLQAKNQQVTISGLSSGAYMAAQMHVAHSKTFQGAAILAGGPYGCSQGTVSGALYACMQTYLGTPSGEWLYERAEELVEQNKIDSLENLASSRVVLVAGAYDYTVRPSVVRENLNFYKNLDPSQILLIDDLPVGHAFPTMDKGNPCVTASQSPWISACGRDVAGEILVHLLGNLQEPKKAEENSFFTFIQPQGHSLDERGIAYVPRSCRDFQCSIHMSLHGCHQGVARGVGDLYFRSVGFNEWAEGNNIIVVYPQAISSYGNPNQCWDWWGYLSRDYLTQQAPQIKDLKSIIDSFVQGSVKLERLQPKE